MTSRQVFPLFALTLATTFGFVACQQPAQPPPPAQSVESAADKAAKTAEANKALAMRFMNEVFNQGKVEALDEIIAPDFVEHQEVPPGTPTGVEGMKGFVNAYRAAFPDIQVTVEQIVASDDLVAIRSTWKATHKGDWMGVKATGKMVEFEVFDVVRIRDGKAVEHWGMDDSERVLTAPSEK